MVEPKVTVLQHGTEHCACYIALTRRLHENYCAFHGYTYQVRSDRRAPNNPAWDKIVDIVECLETAAPGEVIIWLDADTFWVEPTFPLAQALPEKAILGMTAMRMGFFNTGVIFIRACEASLSFWKKVNEGNTLHRAMFPMGHVFNGPKWQEQAYINHELIEGYAGVDALCEQLDSRFNHFQLEDYPPKLPVVIQSWHTKDFSCTMRSLRDLACRAPMLVPAPAGAVPLAGQSDGTNVSAQKEEKS
jgi:hypothetical protein